MKRSNKKWITLMLAGACAASISVGAVGAITTATAAETYATTAIFGTTGGGTLLDYKEGEVTTTTFELASGKSVNYKRSMALHWYEGKDTPKYFTAKFSFKDLNFSGENEGVKDSVTVDIESKASIEVEDEKILNTLKFTTDGTNLKVAVVNDELRDKDGDVIEDQLTYVDLGATKDVSVELAKGSSVDSFKVKVNGVELAAEFTNIGANYAEYASDGIQPLTFTANTKEATVTVGLTELNGQSFAIDEDEKITDNAAPVLVLNQDLTYLQYGTRPFGSDGALKEYVVVDVLQNSSLSTTKQYYQYFPGDTEASYSTISDSTWYVMDKVYYTDGTAYSTEKKEGYTAESQYALNGEEYVSVQFKLKDSSNDAKIYDLSWYAGDAVKEITMKAPAEGEAKKIDFLVAKEDESAPFYHYITTSGTDNKYADTYTEAQIQALEDAYQEKVTEKAAKAKAGSSETVSLPSVEWLLGDDSGYRAMKFTISYKTPTASSPTAQSNRSYSNLTIPTRTAGDYEFKIFAKDATGNEMEYYVDGKLVALTTSNVWDIDEIPTFKFSVAASDLAVEDSTSDTAANKMAEKRIDETYTLSGLTVTGTADYTSAHKLYRIDRSNYTGPEFGEEALTNVKYKTICTQIANNIATVKIGDDGDFKTYFDWYLDIYATEIANAVKGDKDAIRACFVEIQEYNSRITEDDAEWDEYNKYKWNPTDKSFLTAEAGDYIILADFWDKELGDVNRAAGYKLIVVDSKADVIEGDSQIREWIQNNMVSVILFGIAGLMLIAIIVLLLIKPSDETLEDVEAKAAKKAAKKEKKSQ